MNFKTFTLYFILSFSFLNTYSQLADRLYIQSNYIIGKVIFSHKSDQFLYKNPLSIENLEFKLKLSEKKKWHTIYNSPEIGFGVSYIDFGNKEILGNAFGIYSQLKVNMFEIKRFSLQYELISGLAYMNKHYDLITNPDNLLIGSSINYYFGIKSEMQLRLSDRINLTGGFVLNHFSNGRLVMPNRGINTYSFMAGIKYKLNSEEHKSQPETCIVNEGLPKNTVVFSQGLVSASKNYDKDFYCASLAYNYNFINKEIIHIGAGLDVFYNGLVHYTAPGSEETVINETDAIYSGLHGSFSVKTGRSEMLLNVGTTVLKKDKINNVNHFIRVGLRYFLRKNIIVSATLKAFDFRADFIEWGVGYGF
jgi:hypothetical protein